MVFATASIPSSPVVRTVAVAMLAACLSMLAFSAPVNAAELESNEVQYATTLPEDIDTVETLLTSALQGQNYMVIGVLNVQSALKNQGIDAHPLRLVEFINLPQAYKVTRSNEGFEMFAPFRAVLSEHGKTTRVFVLRPRFIASTLKSSGLSAEANATLEQLDASIHDVMASVANGGF